MSRLIKVIVVLGMGLLLFSAVPELTSAQLKFDDAREVAESGGLSTAEPRPLIALIIRTLLGFVGLIAVAVVIYGGVMYITSAGDDSKAEKAKKLIGYAVVGLLLIGTAALIVNVIIAVFQES